MASHVIVRSDLGRRQEAAIREFIEAQGYEHVNDVLHFTYLDPQTMSRKRAEVSANGLTIPTR